MDHAPCEGCGGEVPVPKKRPRDWQKRRFCSVRCANRAPRQRVPRVSSAGTGGRLEEIVSLLESGEAPSRIPPRIGVKPASLSRWLRNRGRVDLARRFDRVDVTRAA